MKTLIRHANKCCLILSSIIFTACAPAGTDSSNTASGGQLHIAIQDVQPFCMQESIALVALNPANIQMSGNAEISGDAVMLDQGTTTISGNGTVQGTLYVEKTSQVKMSGNASATAVSTQDLTGQSTALQNTINSLTQMGPSQTFTTISSGTVIKSIGGLNVIYVSGDLRLSGKDELVLQGASSDTFIINVGGVFSLSGQASVSLQGGILPKTVMINLVGNGSSVSLSGQVSVAGTIFALNRGISISGGAGIMGSVVSGGLIQISGSGQVIQSQAFCSPAGIVTIPQLQPATPPPTTDPGTPSKPPECITNPTICA